MTSLVPCAACGRHVNAGESVCPFCAAALRPQLDAARVCSGPCSGQTFPRLGRAALAAVGATLLCASCQTNPVPMYGPAPSDAVGQTVDAGGQHDGGAAK